MQGLLFVASATVEFSPAFQRRVKRTGIRVASATLELNLNRR